MKHFYPPLVGVCSNTSLHTNLFLSGLPASLLNWDQKSLSIGAGIQQDFIQSFHFPFLLPYHASGAIMRSASIDT